jgi:hypothetical protein
LYRRVAKSGDNQVHQALCSGNEVFEYFSFSASPFFLPNANTQLSSSREFDAVIDLDDWVSGQQKFPVPCKLVPKPFKKEAK